MKLPATIERRVYAARTRLASAVSIPVGFRLMDHRTDDQHLAAFPRSGSTWLRTMLVNVIEPTAHSNPDVFNRVIPGISIRNTPLVRGRPSPRLLMSHTRWRKGIGRAVYLVRDGRDALVSFYHYIVIRTGRTESFDQFFQLYERGVFGDRWDRSVLSWLTDGARELGENLLLVKFEDLRRSTSDVLLEVTEFLRLDSSPELRGIAIEEASLDNMKRIERMRRGEQDPGAAFYRSGNVGDWKVRLTGPNLVRFLEHGGSRALRAAGYDA